MSHPTDRRAFLKVAALIAAQSVLRRRHAAAQTAAAVTATTAASAIDTIVIGAGISGLAAARLLRERGHKVLILEGRNRIGGRVHTDRSLGAPLDLGAGWIQGVDDNPIYDLALELKAKMIESDDDSVVLFDAQGKAISAERQEALDPMFEKLLSQLADLSDDAAPTATVQSAVAGLLDKMPADERRWMEYKLNSVLEHEYAADLADLGLAEWEQDDKFEGDDAVFVRGFDQLPEGMASGLEIKLEQRVSRIEHGGKEVKVTSQQGVFTAKQVIVTVPLGVLKAATIAFEPQLPQRKQTAIRKLAMGSLTKLFLRFPKPFWPKDDDVIGFVTERKGEWATFANIYAVHEQPILCAINSGSFAQQLEQMTDDAIVAEAMKVLRKIFGSAIPNPDAKMVTRWGQDEFSRGAYSHLPPGASADHYDALAEPVGDRLFFAGEATSRSYPGTVHGAYLAGEAAARRVLAG